MSLLLELVSVLLSQLLLQNRVFFWQEEIDVFFRLQDTNCFSRALQVDYDTGVIVQTLLLSLLSLLLCHCNDSVMMMISYTSQTHRRSRTKYFFAHCKHAAAVLLVTIF